MGYETADGSQVAEEDANVDDNTSSQIAASRSHRRYSSKPSRAEFRDFSFRHELMRSIKSVGIEFPSEVQSECIPLALSGRDLMCHAIAGTGKTVLFVIVTLQQIEPIDGVVSVVVLCHSPELAYQIKNEYERFGQYMPNVRTAAFFDGTSIMDDIEKLDSIYTFPHIVVATPKRLAEMLEEGELNLMGAKSIVLDSIDEMLTYIDVREDVQDIFFAAPHQKQVMMFSATLPPGIRGVYRRFLHYQSNEIWIDNENVISPKLQHHVIRAEEDRKNKALNDILGSVEFNQTCIYVKSVPRAIELNRILLLCQYPSSCIHENLSHEECIRRYSAFKDFEKRIMVATETANGNVDMNGVNLIVNYDAPLSAKSYFDRVSRAGRFGREGYVFSFVTCDQEQRVLNAARTSFEIEINPFNIQA
ncbi:ATP-dependent RNA helicase Uap56 [Fennellomyces sp. T-0311]|nr:ATP-dependent RNA helicase Uap56 [Fennellomyces sp. T-0311]